MEDQTTIKLNIPRQDFSGLPLFPPDTAGASNWVQSLPVTNTNSLVQLLGQALKDLNRTKLSPEVRYKVMEILRPNLEVALSNLSKRFLNQPLVMAEEPRRMAELSDRLLTMTATAYTIVAIEAIQLRDAIRETNPARLACEAIQRALIFAGQKVLQNFQLHRPMEIHGWLTLHQLFALADNQRLADLPVPEPLSGGKSITTTYLQALMLGCCKPNQLRQSDLTVLYRAFQQWSELVKLDTQGTGNTVFLVDLDSDQPPLYGALYRNQPGPLCRHIDTSALTAQLQMLKDEKHPSISAALLDHVLTSLSSMSLRNFKRTAADSALWICVGLSSTHFHVAGKKSFEQVLYGTDDFLTIQKLAGVNPFLPSHNKADAWQEANPGVDYVSDVNFIPHNVIDVSPEARARLLLDEGHELPLPERYPIFKFQMADASPSGYCLEWSGELDGDIRVGDIVGLREHENDEWVIAVIRWLSRLENAKTLVGLELLSPRAIAYGARIHQKAGEKTPPMRVLLLPEIKLVGQPQTLITPRTGFKERQKVTIGNRVEAHSVQLVRHITSTGSFSQFEFRYVKELGDVLAEHQGGMAGGEFDSLWSNI
jgi:cyclic-di-GMP-binding protein